MVIGPKNLVRKFATSHWERTVSAKYCSAVETRPGRYVIEFNSQTAPLLEPLRKLSNRWPKLILLLDWEWEDKRLKGFVKANAGRLESSYHLEY